jgi:hypothetical protein
MMKNSESDPVQELDTFLTEKLNLELPIKDRTERDYALREIYKKCISLHQSNIVKKGKALENAIAHMLQKEKIPYLAQACVDKDGNIIAGKLGHHRHDFVVGGAIGQNIADKIVISCKTSLRERFLQDANLTCKRLFMVTYDPQGEVKKEALKEQHNIEVVVIKNNDTSAVKNMLKYIHDQECIGNDFGL